MKPRLSFFLVLFPWMFFAQHVSEIFGPEELRSGQIFLDQSSNWTYSGKLEPDWEKSDFDDSHWEQRTPNDLNLKLADSMDMFEGWLRFRLLKDLEDTELLLAYKSWAAAEVYVNGHLLNAYGNAEKNINTFKYFQPISKIPVPIDIQRNQENLLAIHMVDESDWFIKNKLRSELPNSNSKIRIVTASYVDRYLKMIHEEHLVHNTLRFSINLLIVCLFLLLYYLNPSDRILKHLVFFSLLVTLAGFFNFFTHSTSISFDQYMVYDFVSWFCFFFVFWYLPYLITKILDINIIVNPPYYLIAGILLFLLISIIGLNSLNALIGIVCFIFSAIILVKFKKRINGSIWAVVGELGCTLLLFILLMSLALHLKTDTFKHIHTLFSIMTLSFPVSLLVYIAIRYMETQQDVQQQAEKIVELTEKEKREAIHRQHVLEEKVKSRTAELSQSLDHLKATQSQLIHSEKMASLGELTAGIAHETQNPLNFVNNFSGLNDELIEEINEEIEKGNYEEVKTIVKDLSENEKKITHHGKRAESIVKSMLLHSRSSSGEKELTNLNSLCDEYTRLAFHACIERSRDTQERSALSSSKGSQSVVNTKRNTRYAMRTVHSVPQNKDNGPGISDDLKDKIFQPFLTSKPTGEGTGFGLSIACDIETKEHGERIEGGVRSWRRNKVYCAIACQMKKNTLKTEKFKILNGKYQSNRYRGRKSVKSVTIPAGYKRT